MNRTILAAALLAFAASSALAVIVPVAEDTSTNTTVTKLTPAAGKAPILTVGNGPATLLRFDLSTLPANVTAATVVSARLHFYIVKAKVPDGIVVANITSDWHETDNGPAPSFNFNAFGSIPSAQVASKKFVSVDVTTQIVAFLNGGPDFGFALATGTGKKITIGSKEGPATGFPAYLEIETNGSGDGSGNSSFAGSGFFGGNLILDHDGTNDGTFDGHGLVFGADGSGEQIASKRTAGGNQFGLDFFTGGTNRLSITNDGKVGIGTTAPEDLLHVAAASNNRMLVSAADSGFAGYRQRNSVHEYFTGVAGPDGLWAVVDNTNGSATRLAVAPSGNVGLGTVVPAAKLDVRGDVKLGANGQFFAPAGEQNVRIIRGLVNSSGQLVNGAGYSVARTPGGGATGDYTITYTTPFLDTATVTANPVLSGGNATAMIDLAGASSVRIRTFSGASLVDTNFNFIAVGTR